MAISVLAHIPAAMHQDIKDGVNTDDLTPYFQLAAEAAFGELAPEMDMGTLFVPNGLYHVTSIGIGRIKVVGESTSGTVLKAYSSGAGGDYMLNAKIDVDGFTTNTSGAGWCENLTLDGAVLGSGDEPSGRSGLQSFAYNNSSSVVLKHLYCGMNIEMPMWSRIENIYAFRCGIGFLVAASPDGQSGTSTTFTNCWANESVSYGFQIGALTYSSFINCVSQAASGHGGIGFYLLGDWNGPTTANVAVQLIGCGHEGGGLPFYFQRCLELTVIAPRIVNPDTDKNLLSFAGSRGTVIDFSSVAAMTSGAHYVDVVTNDPGHEPLEPGSIVFVNGNPDWASGKEIHFTRIGTRVGSGAAPTTSSHEYHVDGNRVVGARRSGWALPAGPSNKATFDSASSTLTVQQLAERLKALIEDLTAHGLIGA